jgi:orotate phosphoribosyltransferase
MFGGRDTKTSRRVAIVNDVISAGSAVRGTLEDLRACGAETVAVAAIAVLGPSAAAFAALNNLALESLRSCQAGVALQNTPAGKP